MLPLYGTGDGAVRRLLQVLHALSDGSVTMDGVAQSALVTARNNAHLASNAYWDGGQWLRYDTTRTAMLLAVSPGGSLTVSTAAAGANPIAWAARWTLETPGSTIAQVRGSGAGGILALAAPGAVWLLANLFLDGANAQRQDTGQKGLAVVANLDGTVRLYDTPAGANPATLTERLNLAVLAPAIAQVRQPVGGGSLVLAGGLSTNLAGNAYHDGTNWLRLDTAQGASLVVATAAQGLTLYTAPAGANPIAWTGPVTLTIAQVQALVSPPVTRLYCTAALSLANATFTAIPWDTVSFDTHSLWAGLGAPTRALVPAGWGGYWDIHAAVRYSANANGERYCAIRKNGATYLAQSIVPGGTATSGAVPTCSTLVQLNAGEYIEVQGYQASGAALTLGAPGADTVHLDMAWRRA